MTFAGRAARSMAISSLVMTLLAVTPAIALADQPTALTYVFFDCHGAAGPVDPFMATKEPGGAAAVHLMEGRGVFIAVQATDVLLGTVLFATPGFEHNGRPTVSCLLVSPVTSRLQAVIGMLAPSE